MARAHVILAPLPFVCAIALSGACTEDASHVALRINTKKGLLDDVSAELRVIDAAEAKCSGGFVTPENPPGDAVQSFSLGTSNCESGAKLCAEITLEKDDEKKVFEVVAERGGNVVARGCTTVAVDQDPLDVSITVRPNLPPACCNDGVVQALEQCDEGPAAAECFGTPYEAVTGSCGAITPTYFCDCNCLAREIPLSEDGTTPPLNNMPNTKSDVAITFAGAGGTIANSLRAVFTDVAPDGMGTQPNINVRYLDANLDQLPTPLNQQLRLKDSCTTHTQEPGLLRNQGQADIARINDNELAVVFQDDNELNNPAGNFSINLVRLNDVGCAFAGVTKLNVAKTNALAHPAVAGGPEDTALVVWTDGTALRGRIYVNTADPLCDSCVPAAADIDIGTVLDNTRPRVAGNASGWRVLYTGPGQEGDVFMRTVDPDGNVGEQEQVNTEQSIGAQIDGDIAMQDDGRFMVVWSNAGTLQFQRYDEDGAAIAGDQNETLNESAPTPGATPAVAAGIDSGGFYAAVWVAADNTIWGRYIGSGDRFLINAVNASFDDFLASHPAGPYPRIGPDVAIGGTGFVAVAWTDISPEHPGIYARRLPLPSALVQ